MVVWRHLMWGNWTLEDRIPHLERSKNHLVPHHLTLPVGTLPLGWRYSCKLLVQRFYFSFKCDQPVVWNVAKLYTKMVMWLIRHDHVLINCGRPWKRNSSQHRTLNWPWMKSKSLLIYFLLIKIWRKLMHNTGAVLCITTLYFKCIHSHIFLSLPGKVNTAVFLQRGSYESFKHICMEEQLGMPLSGEEHRNWGPWI